MPTLGHLWAGRLYGTNTGNLFAELDVDGSDVRGTVRFLDSQFGIAVYDVVGRFDDALNLECTPAQMNQDDELGNVTIAASLSAQGSLRGTWHSTIGTAGTLELFPHDIAHSQQPDGQLPEQLFSANIEIGAMRLYADDIRSMISFVRQDFLSGRPIVTYVARGSEVTVYAEDFVQKMEALGELRYLKITIQEPEAHGINKVVVVELSSLGRNVIRVQGIQESWVVGKAEAIARELRKNEKSLVTTYRKFGLNVNQLIFAAMLVLIPDIQSILQRASFVIFVFLLILILYALHGKFIPNAAIYCSPKKPSLVGRALPSILSWVGAVAASLAAAFAYYWLIRGAG